MITSTDNSVDHVTEMKRFFPPAFSLETPRVRLRPVELNDHRHFSLVSKDKEIWKYFTKDLYEDAAMEQWINEALVERGNSKRMAFTIIDKDTNTVAGSSSYGNISFYDKRVEIGWSWLGTGFIGTGVNRQAKFALLSFAFEAMKMQRVEAKTDNLNERAKAGLIKIGMKPEGVLRSHMQMHSNRRRDSIYYSILKEEWEDVKTHFFADLG